MKEYSIDKLILDTAADNQIQKFNNFVAFIYSILLGDDSL